MTGNHKEDDFSDFLVKLGIFLGAMWLGNEFLKSISNQKRCWKCGGLNNKSSTRCYNCGANI